MNITIIPSELALGPIAVGCVSGVGRFDCHGCSNSSKWKLQKQTNWRSSSERFRRHVSGIESSLLARGTLRCGMRPHFVQTFDFGRLYACSSAHCRRCCRASRSPIRSAQGRAIARWQIRADEQNGEDPLKNLDPETAQPIFLCDDNLRRTMVPFNLLKPDSLRALAEPTQKIVLQQEVSNGKSRVACAGPLLSVQPFDPFGRRIIKIGTNQGPLDVIQGVTLITPQWTRVEGLNAGRIWSGICALRLRASRANSSSRWSTKISKTQRTSISVCKSFASLSRPIVIAMPKRN